jgi:hypothetical protein
MCLIGVVGIYALVFSMLLSNNFFGFFHNQKDQNIIPPHGREFPEFGAL